MFAEVVDEEREIGADWVHRFGIELVQQFRCMVRLVIRAFGRFLSCLPQSVHHIIFRDIFRLTAWQSACSK